MSDKLRAMLIRHEGLRLKLYRDTLGKLTIGVGRCIEDVGISEEEAYHLLDNDIFRASMDARTLECFYDLDTVRQDVLTDLCFNMGLARLKGFKKMLLAMEDMSFEDAARELLDSKYASQVGNRAIELAEMIRSGSYA